MIVRVSNFILSTTGFTVCGNPNNVFPTNHSPQSTFVSLGQDDFNNFCNLSQLILKKGDFTLVLANRKKDFSIKKSILGWKSATDNAAFQSSFKI